MNARLRSLTSPDAPDLERFRPDSPAFKILIEAEIGPAEDETADIFGFLVCSPAWIAREVAMRGFLKAYHHLVIEEFDLGLVRSAIGSICEQATGGDWPTLAREIGRHGAWEFEGYSL